MASRFQDFIDLKLFGTQGKSLRKQRETDEAERNILTLLQGSSELSGEIAQPKDPARGFDLNAGPSGLPGERQAFDLSNVERVPVEKSRAFGKGLRNLAASEDRLAEFLTPPAPAKGRVTSTGGITRTIDPSTGKQRGVDIGTASTSSKPARRVYSKRVDGKTVTRTVDESVPSNIEEARAEDFQPHVAGGGGGGKPEMTESKSRKRITNLGSLKLKIEKFGADGLSDLAVAFLKDDPELLAVLTGGDNTAAIAAIDEEVQFHRNFIDNLPRNKGKRKGKELSPEEARAEIERRRNASPSQ